MKQRDIYVLEISPNNRILGKEDKKGAPSGHCPSVAFVGGLRGGSEGAVGKEILLRLAEHLLDPEYPEMKAKVLILPDVNPDAVYETRSKVENNCDGESDPKEGSNHNGVDLDSDFSDNSDCQPETKVLMKWMENIQPSVTVILRSGSPHVTLPPYKKQPYEDTKKKPRKYHDLALKHVADLYVKEHKTMRQEYSSCGNLSDKAVFENGIVMGKNWKPHDGSFLDFCYFKTSTLPIEVFMDCCSYPEQSRLSEIWEENKSSMMAMISDSWKGLHGFIVDELSHPITGAIIAMNGSSQITKAIWKDGEFWRPMPPGTYVLTASAPNFMPTTKIVQVADTSVPQSEKVQVVITLVRDQRVFGLPRMIFIMLTGFVFMFIIAVLLAAYTTCKKRRRLGKYNFYPLPEKHTLFEEDDGESEIFRRPLKEDMETARRPFHDDDEDESSTDDDEDVDILMHASREWSKVQQ
ncbi:hypothetical protein J437_LFUL019133 [Ladona fulva]|uniref:Peptidase M14 domain-containing protein n=1 Tax=Ladona fulva TaxID=123851 RepID=A0A8K0P9W0_LADFU|nr:hypothetical protein J437_LFUL019133 [Ladona fulva]